jgi:hypothetical protein
VQVMPESVSLNKTLSASPDLTITHIISRSNTPP